MTDLKEEGPFRPPAHPWAASKRPILNRVNIDIFKILFSCFSGKVYTKIALFFIAILCFRCAIFVKDVF